MTKFTIKTGIEDYKLFEVEADTLKEAVEKSVADGVDLTGVDLTDANLTGADLTGANLTGADLTGANLTGADLTGADLTGADLTGANLTGANLTGANMADANLRSANLHSANMTGADLTGASLYGANLHNANLTKANLTNANLTNANFTNANFDDNTILDTGETWRQYITETVPLLLTSGGKSVKEVLATGCWECHEWKNCPMHVALGIDTSNEAPPLLRQRVQQFVNFFDSELIPAPVVSE